MKKNFYFILFSALTIICTSCEKTLKEEPVYEKYYIKYTTNDWRTVNVNYQNFIYDNNVYDENVLLSNTCEQGNGVITFMAKVIGIYGMTFYNQDNITSIDLPGTITDIGQYAFENCLNLKSVYIHSVIPPELGLCAFTRCHNDLKIYIPAESEVAYNNASDWEIYKDKLVPTYY